MGNTLYLCRGSDCRKRKAENKKIRHLLGDVLTIEEVGCQKICKGPVVGLKVEGTLHWFRKLDGKKDLVSLQKSIAKDSLSKLLAAKHVKKRTGKLR